MVEAAQTLSLSQARRIALAAQGFCDPQPKGKIDRRHMRRVMDRLKLIQLDSVPVVMRTQYVPPFSRLGPYEPSLLEDIAYRHGEWFETWSHEASLVPNELEPYLRWNKSTDAPVWPHLLKYLDEHGPYVDQVLAEVEQSGPLLASELSDPRTKKGGEWWDSRSGGTRALSVLFRLGRVGIRRVGNFEKQFDLLDRIVPSEIRALPTPSIEDAQRELIDRSAAALGVGTTNDIADYFRINVKPAAARVDELVEEGRLQPVEIEGWKKPGYLHVDAKLPRWVKAETLVSPFDPVVWHRDRAERLFGFEYRIEIYVPKEKRQYGYYVLPFLVGDRLVGRFDLKTDRAAQRLLVQGEFYEDGVDLDEARPAADRALARLAQLVGAEEVVRTR